jgi:uncharacterized protein (DUF1501 family)
LVLPPNFSFKNKESRMSQHIISASRREFLRRTSALSALGVAAPLGLNLATIGAASAQSATDYRALVCVYLYGGNDNANTVIPYASAEYARYAAVRGALALPYSSLQPIAATSSNGRPLALPSGLASFKQLYDAKRCAIVANVGPLNVPTTLAQYKNDSVPIPPKLFSHNDQQAMWQSFGTEAAASGWGGRMADLVIGSNSNAGFTAITIDGYALFLTGRSVIGARVTVDGALDVQRWLPGNTDNLHGSNDAMAAWRAIINTPERNNLLEQEYGKIRRRGIGLNATLTQTIGGAPTFDGVFPPNYLGSQLRTVAKLIASRNGLGMKRQIFFVGIGGFDHHNDLLGGQAGQQALLGRVGGAMAAFDQSMVSLGLGNQVTAFTASEFGRSLDSNGDGSDHGWGGHHFVVGGAVRGGNIYGTFPDVALNTSTDVERGVLLPTTSLDQHAATLARWFGVSSADLPFVTPNVNQFSNQDLGFMS